MVRGSQAKAGVPSSVGEVAVCCFPTSGVIRRDRGRRSECRQSSPISRTQRVPLSHEVISKLFTAERSGKSGQLKGCFFSPLCQKCTDGTSWEKKVPNSKGPVGIPGLSMHETVVHEGGGETLGPSLDDSRLRAINTQTRRWMAGLAIRALHNREKVTSRMVGVLVSHCTFAGLVQRPTS